MNYVVEGLGALAVLCVAVWLLWPKAKPKPVIHPAVVEAVQEVVAAPVFAVTGKPKKAPLRERKKALRAGARTKRKKLEEWSD